MENDYDKQIHVKARETPALDPLEQAGGPRIVALTAHVPGGTRVESTKCPASPQVSEEPKLRAEAPTSRQGRIPRASPGNPAGSHLH